MIPSAPKWKRFTWTKRSFIMKETGSAVVQPPVVTRGQICVSTENRRE